MEVPTSEHDESVVEMGQSLPNIKKEKGVESLGLTARKVTKVNPFHLAWSNLQYSVTENTGTFFKRQKTEKIILDNVNGGVKSG
eukprot:Awhi_evm1s8407